jgi:hypothetical protein
MITEEQWAKYKAVVEASLDRREAWLKTKIAELVAHGCPTGIAYDIAESELRRGTRIVERPFEEHLKIAIREVKP